ncbi:MAG: hypothetical protein ABSC19_05130 [Syntrophorhabdales bacterium]|jgi:hypothetical protein
MDQSVSKAHWTEVQPWRGFLVLAITIGLAFLITSIFDIKAFNGMFTFFTMALVPIEAVIAIVWGGQYPPTGNMHQAWRGLALTLLVLTVGALYGFVFLNFRAAGVLQPFVAIALIISIVLIFFHIIFWGSFPWHNMRLPAKGFLTLITAAVLGGWVVSSLFNFDFLSYPTGVKPSPIGAVPLYAPGGPLAAFSHLAPHGPIPWESGICFVIWSMVPLWILVFLHMWPFTKSAVLTKQPLMGIAATLTCCIISYAAYVVGVEKMNIEPIKFMIIAISYIFGMLMFLNVFQEWPGRTIEGPAGGFINALCSLPIGIIAYYAIQGFCNWHFGPKAMVYPDNVFALGGVMLGVTFPLWVLYIAFWDCWPLPPTPAPGGSSEG